MCLLPLQLYYLLSTPSRFTKECFRAYYVLRNGMDFTLCVSSLVRKVILLLWFPWKVQIPRLMEWRDLLKVKQWGMVKIRDKVLGLWFKPSTLLPSSCLLVIFAIHLFCQHYWAFVYAKCWGLRRSWKQSFLGPQILVREKVLLTGSKGTKLLRYLTVQWLKQRTLRAWRRDISTFLGVSEKTSWRKWEWMLRAESVPQRSWARWESTRRALLAHT